MPPDSIKSALGKVSEDGNQEEKYSHPLKENPANLLQLMEKLVEDHMKHMDIAKTFLEQEAFTRVDITKLKLYVNCYNSLNDKFDLLAESHAKWLPLCGKTEEELNKEKDKFSPDIFDTFLIQQAEDLDRLKAQFLKTLVQYPNDEEFKILLSYFEPIIVPGGAESFDIKSASSCSGRRAEKAKSKLSKLKEKLDNWYTRIGLEFEQSNEEPESLVDELDEIKKILRMGGNLSNFSKILWIQMTLLSKS